jgi:hypothetical protein
MVIQLDGNSCRTRVTNDGVGSITTSFEVETSRGVLVAVRLLAHWRILSDTYRPLKKIDQVNVVVDPAGLTALH